MTKISKRRKVPIREILSGKNLRYRGIPSEYVKATLGDFQLEEALNDFFTKYLTNIELMFDDNVSLILYGKNGNGKTWLSSLIVKEAYIYRFSSFRVTLQSFIDMHFRKGEEEYRDKLNKIISADFLVIDEVGKETFAKNQFNIIVLEELLRQRETLGKPTVICTNLPLNGDGGLFSQYGNSIKSLVEGNYVPIEFNSDDHRRSITKKKQGIQLLMGD